ncbi:class I SAM-dependent methyltransferase [uncultured Roseibium sp.]|uniref:class I SAM-dependent methyltransferase n=1 Tax=uncultured Roseibium sp. TaxID=1936171 RepID=UPI0026180B78|nr:class I SAM-dependent methyltransferase [uncultured Roseibium sp.]
MKKLFLNGPNLFAHAENRMADEGNLEEARSNFQLRRFRNLDRLLRHRYDWMNAYLGPDKKAIEIGAGAGFSKFYLKHEYLVTDVAENDWIDDLIDATDMPLEDGSVDVIIASHNIHHFAYPTKFFRECERVLKRGGVVLIQEINTSLVMRLLLRVMRHEGWSYDVDVFDDTVVANDPSDPWSANCAIPELLFEKEDKFHSEFPGLKISVNEKNECLLFPLSGGVIAKTRVPELPSGVLEAVSALDSVLTKLAPDVFALGRSVVIEKI